MNHPNSQYIHQMHEFDIQKLSQKLLLDQFKTDIPFFDIILATVVILFISNINKILSAIWEIIWNFICKWWRKMSWMFINCKNYLFPDRKLTKTVIIQHITENKQINELYKAVHFYITNSTSIEYLREPTLYMSYDKRIDSGIEQIDLSISKTVPQMMERSFTYQNHIIYYSFSTNLVTIYGDEERKKENNVITLNVTINTRDQIDIMDDFCKFCIKEYVEFMNKKKWIQKVFVNKDGKWIANDSKNYRKVETVILKSKLKKEIMDDIDFFLSGEEWYHNIDIPYSRGYLLYGYPGTGKTSMIKALANYTKRHIHYLLLNEIKSDTELLSLLQEIKCKETILVIEDIDCMTEVIKNRGKKATGDEGQKISSELDEVKQILKQSTIFYPAMMNNNNNNNIGGMSGMSGMSGMPLMGNFMNSMQNNPSEPPKKLTLSGLLNALDGVFNHDGRILIITTNKPKDLDKALIRPGRIDRSFLFDYCDREQIGNIYKMFYQHDCSAELLDQIEDFKYSPSHITGLFMRYHLDPKMAFENIDSGDLEELKEEVD